jgi:hypothetical protein
MGNFTIASRKLSGRAAELKFVRPELNHFCATLEQMSSE